MKAYKSQIVIGLGTGRCGTMSLAYLLNWQENSKVYHEKARNRISWQGDEKTIDKFLLWASEAAKQKRLVGDVAFYYLNYVEYLLSLNPNIKFVCLQRDRASTVTSYMKHTKDMNHWMLHDGTRWQKSSWDHCYPKYEVLSKEKAIEQYWDDYYLIANELQTKYPDSFRIFKTATLNTEAGQRAILAFIGIENPRLSVGIQFNSDRGIKNYLTRFSVIICTHNHADLLKNVLADVCQQSIGHSEFEVIVVDTNSTDETRFVTEPFCQYYPNVRYCFDASLSHAHQRGWHEALGQYVVYIDDECQVPTQLLTVANDIIEQYSPTMFSVLSYHTFYNHSIKYEEVMKDFHPLDNYKPKLNNDWQLHWLDDQPLLFSKSHDGLHLLNPVAGFIWTCCDGKTDVKAIRKTLQDVLVDSQDEVAKDLLNILELWQNQGLINFELSAKKKLYSSAIIDLSDKERPLLIIFSGFGDFVTMPFEFSNTTKKLDVNKIYLRDFSRTWYHSGLFGRSKSIDETVLFLKRKIDESGANKVVVLGNSMGGYAAILFGILIKANIVHAFAPQTFLNNVDYLKLITRNDRKIQYLHNNFSNQYFDLKNVIQLHNNLGEFNIYYDSTNEIDKKFAMHLKDSKHVMLHPFCGGGHGLIKILRDSGELQKIIIASLNNTHYVPNKDINASIKKNHSCLANDNYKPKQNEDWQLHWLDDQPMLFSKSHDGTHLLNPVAGFIWTCCDGKTDVSAIRKALQDVFVESQNEVAKDLPNVLTLWQEQRLIAM